MLKEIKVVLNGQGFYDILVNGVEVAAMLVKEDIAEAIDGIIKDPYGFIADMLED